MFNLAETVRLTVWKYCRASSGTLLLLTVMVAGPFSSDTLAAFGGSANVQAELIAENSSIQAGEPFWVALREQIKPGWHTYWKNPGDSGAPSRLTWSLPDGFTASDIHWPIPERIPYGPLMNFGYEDEVLLLVQITPSSVLASDTVVLKARGDWLVCADICIPEKADLELTLPVNSDVPAINEANRTAFAGARAQLPRHAITTSTVALGDSELVLDIAMPGLAQSRITRVDFFPYEEAVLDFPAEQRLLVTDSGLQLTLKPGYAFDPATSTLNGIVVVKEDVGDGLTTAFEVNPKQSDGVASVPQIGSQTGLLLALLFAFLGGLILNLMPCVFPVLSIKILSLIESTHSESTAMRHHGLAYLAGVIASFMLVAALLIFFRAGGQQIGWGFQLQSPVVVGLLVYLFVLIGLNLSGYFEFGLSVSGAGESMAGRGGYSGSFFTGVLAAVVAAPCTAPFMGVAIGYALTQDAASALLVFVALGFGMAVPYVLLCFSPSLLAHLPKPGAWMQTLKELFAFPMFAAAIWLIWVFNQQTGADQLLALLVGILCLGLVIWLSKRHSAGIATALRHIGMAALTLTALGMLFLIQSAIAINGGQIQSQDQNQEQNIEIAADSLNTLAYSKQALQSALAEGPVFVNFTAAWCITCKVNDIAALSTATTRQAFADYGVRYMVGDWTNEDPQITTALAEYGRSGVPLYLLYAKGSSKAKVLPQILTESVVLEALQALADNQPKRSE